MSNTDLLKKYIPIAEFISEILGDNCEVVIHDITSPNNSIIFIKNGNLSGRTLYGPLTNLVMNIIQSKSYKKKNFVANYKAVGNFKTFRSASYFIKNKTDEIIGVLCVNIDIEPYNNMRKLLDKLSFISDNVATDTPKTEITPQEHLSNDVDDLLTTMINETIEDVNIVPARMSVDEKIYIVRQLFNKGAFNLKGAVSQIAKALEVSEPTIYRYLNRLR